MSDMNIGYYIRQLLPENETVVFPGLGAFFLEYSPAEIMPDSDEILPPSGKLLFSSKIRNDDGLLSGFIAQSESIPVQEALRKIKETRDDILYQLDKGEKAHLDNLGILFYDENHVLQFEPFPGENLFAETFGLEIISTKDTEEIPEEVTETVEPEPVIPPKEPVADHLVDEPDAEEHSAEIPSVPPVQEPAEKKRRGGFWLWLLLLAVLAGAVLFFFLKKEKKETPAQKTETVVTPEPEEFLPEEPADSTTSDSLHMAVELSATDSLSVADEPDMETFSGFSVPDTSKYYLVGGSFSKLKNAEEYFQQMKNKGYSPQHLGLHGSFYLVAIEIFDNSREAFREQYNFLDRLPDSGVWVYKPEKSE